MRARVAGGAGFDDELGLAAHAKEHEVVVVAVGQLPDGLAYGVRLREVEGRACHGGDLARGYRRVVQGRIVVTAYRSMSALGIPCAEAAYHARMGGSNRPHARMAVMLPAAPPPLDHGKRSEDGLPALDPALAGNTPGSCWHACAGPACEPSAAAKVRTHAGSCGPSSPIDEQGVVERAAAAMPRQVEVGVLHDVDGRLAVRGGVEDAAQHAPARQHVRHRRHHRPRVALRARWAAVGCARG